MQILNAPINMQNFIIPILVVLVGTFIIWLIASINSLNNSRIVNRVEKQYRTEKIENLEASQKELLEENRELKERILILEERSNERR